MVGATPAAAAAIVNGCCTLMATNPTVLRVDQTACEEVRPTTTDMASSIN
jgi:hypothetical protein